MEILPNEDALTVELQVSPSDIDIVAVGLPGQLRFTALNQRTIPMLMGRVTQVSADRLLDQRTGQVYYTARTAIEDDGSRYEGFRLYPDMPVEGMIVTGARTPFAYLAKPILAGLTRALREE